MPYGGDPAGDTTDAVRLLIFDTSTGSPLLSDAEVDYFVAQEPNVHLAAAEAARTIAAKYGPNVDKQVGDLRLSESAKNTNYNTLAADLRRKGVRSVKPYAGGISIADKDAAESDTDWNRPSFKIGQYDNPNSSTGGYEDY